MCTGWRRLPYRSTLLTLVLRLTPSPFVFFPGPSPGFSSLLLSLGVAFRLAFVSLGSRASLLALAALGLLALAALGPSSLWPHFRPARTCRPARTSLPVRTSLPARTSRSGPLVGRQLPTRFATSTMASAPGAGPPQALRREPQQLLEGLNLQLLAASTGQLGVHAYDRRRTAQSLSRHPSMQQRMRRPGRRFLSSSPFLPTL